MQRSITRLPAWILARRFGPHAIKTCTGSAVLLAVVRRFLLHARCALSLEVHTWNEHSSRSSECSKAGSDALACAALDAKAWHRVEWQDRASYSSRWGIYSVRACRYMLMYRIGVARCKYMRDKRAVLSRKGGQGKRRGQPGQHQSAACCASQSRSAKALALTVLAASS
jgi:hypothetical protein